MGASFQPLAGVLRVHGAGGVYGDAYTWSCAVALRGSEAVLYGALVAPGREERLALRELFRELGVTDVYWERIKEGRTRVVHFRVERT